MSDVENWTLGRNNELRKRSGQTIRVVPSGAIPTDTLLTTHADNGDSSKVLRLSIEELDALIILLQYRRSLIKEDTDE